MNIWLIVGIAIILVLFCILVARIHAFLTLLLAGFLVALLASGDAMGQYTSSQVIAGKMSVADAQSLMGQNAITRLAIAFGEMVGKIGILIALASVIGQCLLESRAATVIVDRMIQRVGQRRAPEALAASSFVLAIPVFFDTVFYLMIPLARSLRERVGKNYVLFILAILAGGSIAHSLVPPTPGPLIVAGLVGVDVATMMIAGLVIGSCSSIVCLLVARFLDRLVDVPLRPIEGMEVRAKDLEADGDQSESTETDLDTPSFLQSIAPIAIPVFLIALGSVIPYLHQPSSDLLEVTMGDLPSEISTETNLRLQVIAEKDDSIIWDFGDQVQAEGTDVRHSWNEAGAYPLTLKVRRGETSVESSTSIIVVDDVDESVSDVVSVGQVSVVPTFTDRCFRFLKMLGNKNIAIAIGVVLAMLLMKYCPADNRKTLVTRSLGSAGNIILITAAGGAFGVMLRQAGIETAVGDLASGLPGLMLLPVAFLVTTGIRTLQGSATVAMITAAGILQGLAASQDLPFHPVYLAMAIGAGSKPISWMTDSAFWVMTRMSGMTEAEGLRTISPMSIALGLSALFFTMLFAAIYPAI